MCSVHSLLKLELCVYICSVSEPNTSPEPSTADQDCDLQPNVVQSLCTTITMQSATVSQADAAIQAQIVTILDKIFQNCQKKTFSLKIDLSLEF